MRRSAPLDIAHLRKDYAQASLDLADVDRDPLAQFARRRCPPLAQAVGSGAAGQGRTAAVERRPWISSVRLRITNANGDVVDQLLSKAEKPSP